MMIGFVTEHNITIIVVSFCLKFILLTLDPYKKTNTADIYNIKIQNTKSSTIIETKVQSVQANSRIF